MKKILMATTLLTISMASHASLISHLGYERAVDSNIVTGGGLEWLKWDVTAGKSINQAIADHQAEGWILASLEQITALFNVFQFGKTDWVSDGSIYQEVRRNWTVQEDSSHNSFIELFGFTDMYGAPYFADGDPYLKSFAYFGLPLGHTYKYGHTGVIDDTSTPGGFYNEASAHIAPASWVTADYSEYLRGVALVREKGVHVSVDTPNPETSTLLLLCLMMLKFRRRQTRLS